MDDLVQRLREDDGLAERIEAADRIEALEARIAKADALADGLGLVVDAYGCDCAAEVYQLVKAYRADQ